MPRWPRLAARQPVTGVGTESAPATDEADDSRPDEPVALRFPHPGVVHFFSYSTGVSIELPLGFYLGREDDTSVTYVERGDGAAKAALDVRLAGELESADPAAVAHRLAEGFAAQGELLSRADRTVDAMPATTVVSRRTDGSTAHQTVVAGDGRLVSLVGLSPPERADELVAAFDRAVRSVRLIVP